MRFNYDEDSEILSVYVKQSEFDLAANGQEYRVFKQKFSNAKMAKFLQDYSFFIKKILESIVPGEEVYDVVALSNHKKVYMWKSLLNLEHSRENDSYFENMFEYSLFGVNKELIQKNNGKNIEDVISKEDEAKLSMILHLMDFKTLPEPKSSKRHVNKIKLIQKKIKSIDDKLKVFETKYGFSSDEMYKYYGADEFDSSLEEEMLNWLSIYDSKLNFLKELKKQDLLKTFIKNWIDAS